MKNLLYLLAVSIAVASMMSCEKDENVATGLAEGDILSRSSQAPIPQEDPAVFEWTELGEEVEHPFSIHNLRTALFQICGDSTGLTVTDRLIKFSFTTLEDYAAIQLDSNFILYSFPLNRRVNAMGDLYDSGRGNDEIHDLYGIVSVDKTIPSRYTYSILDEYSFEVSDLALIVKSFDITDNLSSLNPYLDTKDVTDFDTLCERTLQDIIYVGNPELACPDGCTKRYIHEEAYGKIYIHIRCDCPPPNPVLNDCDCPTYNTSRSLAGCVDVIDNDWGGADTLDRVQDVEIIVQDRFSTDPFTNLWFKSHKTTTDANGCWRIDHQFSDNVFVWVRFVNDDSYERYLYVDPVQTGLDLDIAYSTRPIKDYAGAFAEGDYNNIHIIYEFWGGTQTKTELQRNWGAATANNAVKDFIARTTNISAPPPKLDLLLVATEARGAALMLDFSNNIVTNMLIPDLSIGLDRTSTNIQNQLTYHELAHASHFSHVGANWWSDLFLQEFTNAQGMDGLSFTFDGNPYGNGTEPNAGHVILAESWAESLAWELVGRNRENRHFRPRDTLAFIPEGLYNDLEDNTPGEILNGTTREDNISGYDRTTMFQMLDANTETLEQYHQQLLSQLPAGNTPADLDSLITSYTQ